jgi:dTDP-4-dehydrorhamnose 3,5-epimerase
MPFHFTPTEIPDVLQVSLTRHSDARGFFTETYRASAFDEALGVRFVQDNLAGSGPRVLRGLHFQRPPKAQGKLVRVVRGAIFDVAVDLRPDSATYGRWVGRTLDASSGEMLWIPAGFAHGYVVTSDEGADVAYKVTEEYDAGLDAGVRWDDPEIGVVWPVDSPILSDRDRALPALAEIGLPFHGVNG